MLYSESLEPRRLLSGVTILTHGYNGSTDGWVSGMADAITARAGDASQYTMIVNRGGSFNSVNVLSLTLDSGSPSPSSTSSGEIIVKLDWSQISSGEVSTKIVGDAVAEFMLESHAGIPPLADFPIHLIGHSRGASVNVEIANDLGTHGIWVDQQTFLDPHPVDGIDDFLNADFGDVPMSVGENVIFADNYWRSTGQVTSFDFNGEPVDNAHNQNLLNSVQQQFVVSAHQSVPAYYHGTIDLDANTNGEEPIFDSWYGGSDSKPARDETGFIFSQIAGAARPADGLSAEHDGNASRELIDEDGNQWANVADLKVLGDSSIPVGHNLKLAYTRQDRDSTSTIEFFIDPDRNPLNGNAGSLGTRTDGESDSVDAFRATVFTSGLPRGRYFVFAKITDAQGNIRYAPANKSIKLETAGEDQTFTRLTTGGTLTILGTSSGDVIGIVEKDDEDHFIATRGDFSEEFDKDDVSRIQFDSGDGNDTITIGDGVPGVYANAGNGNDTLNGGEGNDTLSGGTGKNVINGNDGDDRLNGSNSLDTLNGGRGNDRLYGNGNSDQLDGGDGIDRLFGGDGNDNLSGGSSNDKLYGEAGNDTLNGGKGSDILNGGPGLDTAITDGLDSLLSIEA